MTHIEASRLPGMGSKMELHRESEDCRFESGPMPAGGLKCPNCEGRGWTNYMNPNTYQFSPGIHSQCMWCWGEGTLTAERLAECRAQ